MLVQQNWRGNIVARPNPTSIDSQELPDFALQLSPRWYVWISNVAIGWNVHIGLEKKC
jgi:hypothetical protein